MRKYLLYSFYFLTQMSTLHAMDSSERDNAIVTFGEELVQKNPEAAPTVEMMWAHKTHLCFTGLSSLKNVRCLHLGSFLAELPRDIGLLESVEELHVSIARLDAIPETIKNMGRLCKLGIAHARKGALPMCIGEIENLSELSLHCSSCRSLTKNHFAGLAKLEVFIDESGDRYRGEKLSTFIGGLPDSVDDKNDIGKESDEELVFGTAQNLKELRIEGYHVAIPEAVVLLSGLKKLKLGTFVTAIPDGLPKLRKLKSLEISTTRGDILPNDLKDAVSLLFISVAHVSEGDVVAKMPPSVVELNLHCSEIIEEDFARLPSLLYLQKVSHLRNEFGFCVSDKAGYKLRKELDKIKRRYPLDNDQKLSETLRANALVITTLKAAHDLLRDREPDIDVSKINPILLRAYQQCLTNLDEILTLVEFGKQIK